MPAGLVPRDSGRLADRRGRFLSTARRAVHGLSRASGRAMTAPDAGAATVRRGAQSVARPVAKPIARPCSIAALVGVLLGGALTGCSTMDALNPFGDDDKPKSEKPAE